MWDTSRLRKTSEVTDTSFPWAAPTVPLILVGAGVIEYAQTKREKLDLLGRATKGDVILCVWPGRWCSDAFVVDDVASALAALTP